MGFRFGFSIDIYAKIQNFKSIAAMQLFYGHYVVLGKKTLVFLI